jgi:cell division protein FtsB
MRKRHNFKTFILIYIFAGVYVFVFGGSGILERMTLAGKRAELLTRIDKLRSDNKKLETKLSEYAGGQITEADFLDAGFIAPGRRALTLKGLSGARENLLTDERAPEESGFRMTHLRVLWGVAAALTLLFYFSRKKKDADDIY